MIITTQVCAQNEADSLLRVLGYPGRDTAAVLALYDAAYQREQTEPQTALELYRKGISWSQKIRFGNGVGKGFNYAGIVWFNLGKIDSALAYTQQSLAFFENAGNRRSLAASLNNIGNCYNVWNDAPEAIRYYQQANAVYESIGEEINVITNLGNIGVLLTRGSNYEQAQSYLNDALNRSERAGFLPGLADANLNLGVLEQSRERYPNALVFFQKAAALYRQLGQVNHYVNARSNLGWCYHLLGDNHQALTELLAAQRLLDTLDLPREKASLMANLGLVYLQIGDLKRARHLAEEALPAAEAVGDLSLQARLLGALGLSCEKAGDFAAATATYQRLAAINRRMFDTEKNNQLLALERRFETEKKERRILAQQLQLQQKDAQNRLMLLLIAVLVLAGLSLILWLRSRLRYNQRIAAQQAEIQEQRIRQLQQEQKLLAAAAMLEGQEEERKRIAKDLHDGLGGLLSAVKLHFNAIQDQVKQLETLAPFQRAGRMIDQACQEVRRISHNMMPGALDTFGLTTALQDLVESLNTTGAVNIVLRVSDWEGVPGDTRDTMLYRIAQELLHNAVKHANAANIVLTLLREGQEILLQVEDDGQGFDTMEHARQPEGLGLKSVQSRVRYLGGSVQIESSVGEGTKVTVRAPC